MDLTAGNLGSVTGILVLVTILVEVVKRLFGTMPIIAKIPVFVFAGIFALILTFIASQIGTLQGNRSALIWQAVITALGSSGFYEWLRNGKNAIGTTVKAIVIFLLPLMVMGCTSRAELIILREGVAAGMAPINKEYVQWADERKTEGKLTEQDYAIRKRLVDDLNNLIQQSRNSD